MYSEGTKKQGKKRVEKPLSGKLVQLAVNQSCLLVICGKRVRVREAE